METIRIRRHLDSEQLNLPELRPLIGRDVEITVVAEEKVGDAAAAERIEKLLRDVDEIAEGYDFEAWKEMREKGRL